mmetsp:Transcript_8996/g.23564  ORF Transcript_8996/g.23564 Transcript_8996/m.23564 type:complete len:214 (+) Transcript_8996:866-1507(+)
MRPSSLASSTSTLFRYIPLESCATLRAIPAMLSRNSSISVRATFFSSRSILSSRAFIASAIARISSRTSRSSAAAAAAAAAFSCSFLRSLSRSSARRALLSTPTASGKYRGTTYFLKIARSAAISATIPAPEAIHASFVDLLVALPRSDVALASPGCTIRSCEPGGSITAPPGSAAANICGCCTAKGAFCGGIPACIPSGAVPDAAAAAAAAA